jgi:ligand-binding sensor domain-containing protein
MMRKKYNFLLYVFFITALPHVLHGQHPAYYQLNDEDGLPSNEIYRIIQDSFGFIWIGCDAGLYRYDGFNLKHYTNARQNGRGISFLQVDKQQRIWCKNFFGQIYRVEGDSLKIIWEHKTSNPSAPQFSIDENCHLWTHYKNTISRYNDQGDSLSTYSIGEKNTDKFIIALYYHNKSIYIAFNNLDFYKFDPITKKSQKLNDENNLDINSLNCMFSIHRNDLLVLVETNKSNKKYRIYQLSNGRLNEFYNFGELDPDKRIYSIYSDGDNLWYTSSGGAAIIAQKETSTFTYSSSYFTDKKVSFMLKDREGMYWFSTLQDGLMVVQSPSVISINPTNSILPDKNITSIYSTPGGKILFGLYTGQVFEYDCTTTKVAEKYSNPREQFIAVKSIYQNKRYTIISRGRFCIIDNLTQKQYYPLISNLRDFELVGDTLYIVCPHIIAKQSITNLIKSNRGELIQLHEMGGRAIEYDSLHHTFYFATGEGTFQMSHHGVWTELTHHGKSIYSNSMHFTNGILWLATVANGVYGFENNQVKYHYHSANLLGENDIRLIRGSNKSIWLSTENYIYHIFYETNSIAKYNQYNAINSREINAISSVNNFVFLATNKGLVFFPENMPWKNTVVPNISIEGVYLNGVPIRFFPTIQLSHSNRNVKVDFTSTAFKSKGSFKYQYRLAGIDTNWIDIAANTSFINFTKLPVGSYQLELRSVNEHHVNSKSILLGIEVNSPFWQKWWFYAISVVLLIIILVLGFSLRIKYIKKRANLMNKLSASQLTALKSQMNPHFLFNTLNSLQDLILKHDIKNSNYYLGKYSTLMRMVLNASGKDEISIAEEVEMLDTYLQLEKLRFGDGFSYTIQVDQKMDADQTRVPPMIIQPFVENAIKHGLLHKKGPKELSIRLVLDQQLICIIKDNGVGRKKAGEINSRQKKNHQSFATSATEKRIELLNSLSHKKFKFTITDLEEHGIATGTQVVIELGNEQLVN